MVRLEFTTRCTAHCCYCPRHDIITSGKREIHDISLDLLQEIINQLKQYRKLVIVISGLGEPLCHPKFIDALNMLKVDLPYARLELNINGSVLHGEKADALIDTVDKINIGVNVADRETYEECTGLKLDVVTQNVISFLEKKGDRKPDVKIRYFATSIDVKQLRENMEFWKPHLNENDGFMRVIFSNWAGKITQPPYIKTVGRKHKACVRLYQQKLTVNSHGEVYVCCMGMSETSDSILYLGNVKEQNLTELFKSEQRKTLQKLHEKEDYPHPCNVCDRILR